MFVSFADAVRAPDGDACTLVVPERGLFAVAACAPEALAIVTSSLDAGSRTSKSTDDIAEVIDGVDEELHQRSLSLSLAVAVVEDDAIGFFNIGTCMSVLYEDTWARRAIVPDERAGGPVRFFRAYVRERTKIALLTEGAWARRRLPRDLATASMTGLAKEAEFFAEGRGSLAPAAVIVLRVDEEPRIR